MDSPKSKEKMFRKGDRFYIERNEKKLYGTVLHVRKMYGGPPYTYMVEFDDDDYTEHNANSQFMVRV